MREKLSGALTRYFAGRASAEDARLLARWAAWFENLKATHGEKVRP